MGDRQRLEAVAGGIEDGIQDCWDHGVSSRLPPFLWGAHPVSVAATSRFRGRAAANRTRAPRDIDRGSIDHCPGRLRKAACVLEQRVTHTHCKAALRLPDEDFRDQLLAAFEYTVGFRNTQCAGRASDLNADQRPAHRGVSRSYPVVAGRWKLDLGAIESMEISAAFADCQRVDVTVPLLSRYRKARA